MTTTKWEYLSRNTFWVESGRGGDYIERIGYRHVWRIDPDSDARPFPDDEGFDMLGKSGWELVAMSPEPVSLLTAKNPQKGGDYSEFTTYFFMFKRRASL